MRFSSVTDLLEYIYSIDAGTISEYDIRFVKDSSPIVEEISNTVKILSLSDSPEIKTKSDKKLDENVLYVDDYTSIPNACSTGKVEFMGREIFTNICEDDSGSVIYLNLSLNEEVHHGVPFRLRKTIDNKSGYILMINPEKLSNHEN